MAAIVKTKLKAAREALGRKDYKSAEDSAQQVLSFEPDNYNANVFLGLASLELGKNEQSEEAYLKATVSNPNQVLAWQGLSKYYEKTKTWDKFAAILERLMDIFAKSDDVSKCAETLQRYLELQRLRKSPEQLSEALGLLLPDSRYYSLLSTLPAPEPTAPTSTPTYLVQSAIHNSFPILEELLAIEEDKQRAFITREVAKRRTRLDAPPLPILTADVEREAWITFKLRYFYGEILNHPYTSDDLRRNIESKLLRHLHGYLTTIPSSPDMKKLKAEQRAEVEAMADGAVLLSIPDLLAWTIYIEGRDVEHLEQYDPKMLLRFILLFPEAVLTPIVRGFLLYNGLPIKEDEGVELKPQKPEVTIEAEDPYALVLDSFPSNTTSIFAHRVMSQLHLESQEHDLALRVAEAGLTLVNRSESNYDRPLSLTRKALNICVAIALVHLFPPKHHLRAASMLDDILDSDSNNIVCLMGRATIYQYSQKWKKAVELFARVQKLKGPDDIDEGLEAWEQKVWCAIQDGQVDDGIAELRLVLDRVDSLRGREAQKARTWYRLGRAVWDKEGEHRAESYPHFVTALRRQAIYAPAYTSLGIYYMDYVTPPDVIRGSKCFQKAFELDPREGEAARRLASNFADETEWDLVAVVANRVIAGEGGISGGLSEGDAMSKKQCLPTNSWAWKAMGVVELTRRHYPQAIQAFQVVLRAEEGDFEAWLRLGEAYASAGRHVAALKALERAQTLSPGDWGCLCIKGDVLRQVHQYEKALGAFHEVLDMRPGETGVLIALANTYLDLGREQQATGFIARAETSFSMAIDTAVRVITDAPGFRAIAWKAMGDALFELAQRPSLSDSDSLLVTFDRVTQALGAYTSTEASSSGTGKPQTVGAGTALSLALKVYRARLFIVEGDNDSAGGASFDVAAVLQRLAMFSEGESQSAMVEEAIGLVKRAIRATPGDASSWNALGTLRFLQEPKLAQHAFTMALEVDGKNAATWSNLGLLYLHHHDLELANHAFYRAQTLDPDYALAWIGQALIATAHGHLHDARALLEHAVGLPAGVPAADLEFAVRIFTLFLSQESGSMSTESLFLPFSVLSRYNQRRPDDSTALHLLALICERLGQEEKAVKLLQETIKILDVAYNQSEDSEIERQYAIAHANLGRTFLALSDYSSASDAFEVALNLLPEDSQDDLVCALRGHSQWGIGLTAYKLGDLTKALSTLEVAMESIPAELVDIRGHVCLTLAQTLWGLGGDEARESGKNQLFSAITENPKNMDAITTLAAFGILTLDDDLVDAAFMETLEMPLNERHALDPGRTVERLLVQHNLSKGRVKEALRILESAVHAEPENALARQALATMLIRQGDNERAQSVLSGLLERQEHQDRASLPGSLSLHSVAISGNTPKNAVVASKESQRAVFLAPTPDSQRIMEYCRIKLS
ncbi:Superkiller protein 3 [Tulasnella sp. JGI-2019a]|nr:Superkiller protein 3 [Tulasnella sp. JGI-2019a]